MHNLCQPVSFQTEDQFILNGLWFNQSDQASQAEKPKRAIIFIHGLTSSVFAGHSYLLPLLDNETAILFFNNRGHDKVAKLKKLDPDSPKGTTSHFIGAAHEIFTDCVYDLQAAVDFVREQGIEEIILVGHSTGCQKSVYYASQLQDQNILKGIILLCPLSDYAAAVHHDADKKIQKAVEYAKKLLKEGKPHELLPVDVWPQFDDAQRFLSLYTPDSAEEIFTYASPDKEPATLKKVSVPMCVVFAGQDEYADRPAEKIQTWFSEHTPKETSFKIIPDALHSFHEKEFEVVEVIKTWLSEL